LIKQELFQTSPAGSKRVAQIFEGEVIAQRFGSELLDLLRFVQVWRPDDLHQTEMSLILKYESLAVFEIHDGVSEFRIIGGRVEEHEFSAHPKMRYQSAAVIEIKEYMLASAMHKIYPGSAELRRESFRIGIGGETSA
jgi:hypothetical protein